MGEAFYKIPHNANIILLNNHSSSSSNNNSIWAPVWWPTKGSLICWDQNIPNYKPCWSPWMKHGSGGIMLQGYTSIAAPWTEPNTGQSEKKISGGDLRLGQRFSFQHNNDSRYAAKATMQWFKNNKLNVVGWPIKAQTLIWWQIWSQICGKQRQRLNNLPGNWRQKKSAFGHPKSL